MGMPFWLYIICNMSVPGPAYLFGPSLVQESPIADKYYLQLADHSLLELLRQAVRSILVFNLPLEELPILHLQKEIYLIYDNRFVKEQDVLEVIKHEIRETAKLQKKFLDMSFTYLEKEKASLSDMRDPEEDAWSLSWTRHRAKDTDDSLKKSYGVVANLFCNNYSTFVQSFREIAHLLDHLHREGLIPAIDTEQLEESLLEIVTHQFFLQYNCLDLHKVLPIMAQQHKERFVFSSNFGVELRKKISKYSCDPSLYDLFMPKKQERHPSPTSPSPSPSPPADHENKNELKKLMKEMFLKEFRNNDIISPLLFDEKGKLKLFDPDFKDEDEEEEQAERTEREIAKLLTKRALSSDPKKALKPEEQARIDAYQEAIMRDAFPEEPQKETTPEGKPDSPKKEVKSEPLKPQPKPDPKDKKSNGSPLKSETNPLPQTALKEKKAFEIPLVKTESKKEEQDKIAKSKPDPVSQKVQAKEAKLQLKDKSKSESAPVKEDKVKVEIESKAVSKQAIKEEKLAIKKKESKSPQPIKQASKQKEAPAQSLQISTTKIVLSSGTTLQARVTSLTISAEDPDKFNKNINLLKEIHTMRKSMSNAEVLQQLAKDYGQPEIKLEGFGDKPRGEEDDREDNEPEEGKKKRKKNKKKKNKKGEQLKEDFTRAKSQSIADYDKPQLVKTPSLQKTESSRLDSLTEEERAIYSNIENLQIDDKARVECKIDEQVLNGWRRQFFALKKSFPK